MIQSILFNKDNFTKQQAINYIKKHKYKLLKIHETDQFYRVRQVSPKNSQNYYYYNMYHPTIEGIIYVIMQSK